MKIKVQYNVEVPRVPNFLMIGGDDEKIPISAVTEEGLREIGRQWTENLVARAKEMGSKKTETFYASGGVPHPKGCTCGGSH